MAELNKIKGIIVGQYGTAITLTIVDKDGVAVDISVYTTSKVVTLRDPYMQKAVNFTATFVSDGTDGQIQFTPTAGDIDRAGVWEGQVKLEAASALVLTRVFDVEVEKKISVSS